MEKLKFEKKGIKKRGSAGITLIALVVTIIVLLILAGVSISMLAGDNGILRRAVDSNSKSDEARIKEKIKLANNSAIANGLGKLTYENLKIELAKEFGVQGTDWDISDEDVNPWVITVGGIEYENIQHGGTEQTEIAIKLEMKSTSQPPVVAGSIASLTEENIPIPTGFYVVGGSKSTGLIISDNQADEGKGTDHDTAQTLVGNQYVWIPVDQNQHLSLDVNSPEEITSIKLIDPSGEEINLGISGIIGKTYQKDNITPTFNGIYNVEVTTESGTTYKTLNVRSLYATDTFNDYYTDERIEGEEFDKWNSLMNGDGTVEKLCKLLRLGENKTMKDFKAFVLGTSYTETEDYTDSVNKCGGFYIGRYEAGNVNGNLVCKANVSPYVNVTKSSAKALADGTVNGVSHLVTNAAWDRVLGWLITTNNKTLNQVTANSSEWGNTSDNSFTSSSAKTNTGIYSQTSAKGIYDMAGNVWEWTSTHGPCTDGTCVVRGGFYQSSGSMAPANYRDYDNDAASYNFIGFRVALYL